jgi:hypothetical protein
MADECASCEADDELLFTCSYCDEQFCATHQFPHHACDGFGRAGEANDRSDGSGWLPASSLGGEAEAWGAVPTAEAHDAVDVPASDGGGDGDTGSVNGSVDPAAAEEGSTRPVTMTAPEPSARAESLSSGTWGGSRGFPVNGGESVVNVRPMDSRHVIGGTEASAAPRTVGDWISRQTYLTLVAKVGVIALLINSAFYGGMAVTLYGLLPFAL